MVQYSTVQYSSMQGKNSDRCIVVMSHGLPKIMSQQRISYRSIQKYNKCTTFRNFRYVCSTYMVTNILSAITDWLFAITY